MAVSLQHGYKFTGNFVILCAFYSCSTLSGYRSGVVHPPTCNARCELWSISLHSGIFSGLHHYHVSTTPCPRHPLTPTQQPRNHGYNWPCCQKEKTFILHINEKKIRLPEVLWWCSLSHLSRAGVCRRDAIQASVVIFCRLIRTLWCKFMCKCHLWSGTLFDSRTTCFTSELAHCLKAPEAACITVSDGPETLFLEIQGEL